MSRVAFIGDDFTGSTDALESYTLAGRCVRSCCTIESFAEALRDAEIDVVGMATIARSQSPVHMRPTIEPLVSASFDASVHRLHYKCCSTFDSSPAVGSLGVVLDILGKQSSTAIVGGTPALGRYCIFGQIYARFTDKVVYRIDRHPSMSRHPVTPMLEADLRRHLARQTERPIDLVDITSLRATPPRLNDTTLIDGLNTPDLARAKCCIDAGDVRTIVGGSGACEAIAGPARVGRDTVDRTSMPIMVISGSCSPATSAQIARAVANGFAEAIVRGPADANAAIDKARAALAAGRSIVIHTDAAARLNHPVDATLAAVASAAKFERIILCGGDTSGRIATELAITSIQMLGCTVRGVPVCRVHSSRTEIDQRQFLFKGGQIGPSTFFCDIRDGAHL